MRGCSNDIGAFWRLAKTGLFMRGRSSEQVCLCEVVAMTQLEHCMRAFCEVVAMTQLEHCTRAFWRFACLCEAVAMTQLEHCTRAFWRLPRTGLFMRSRSNDTIGTLLEGSLAIDKNRFDSCEAVARMTRLGTLHEGLSGDWQEQACLCENDTFGTLHEGFSVTLGTLHGGLFMAIGRSNDTIGKKNIARGLCGDWHEQACSCEATAMTQLEHCTKGFLVIGKNRLDYAKAAAMAHFEHCTRACCRFARTGLILPGRKQ